MLLDLSVPALCHRRNQAQALSGLLGTLKSEGPFTLFASMDEAFDALPRWPFGWRGFFMGMRGQGAVAHATLHMMLKQLTFACVLAAQPVHATGNCASDAMIVFDGSGSMAELDVDVPSPRIFEARDAMRRALPQIEPFRNLGLLIYGPGPLDGCSNIDLKLMPRSSAAASILHEVEQLSPGGMTPIARSVRAAAEALEYRDRPSTIVLITDGNETCGGTPCALGQALQASAHDLTIHVIGFKIRIDPFSWDTPEQSSVEGGTSVAKCLSDATGGTYASTETVEELVIALNETLGCALIGALPRARVAG